MDSFLSPKNRGFLFNAIGSNVKNNLNADLNDKAKGLIINAISYVKSKVSPTPPPNMNPEQYTNLMNKKVVDLVLPIIYKGGMNSPSEVGDKTPIRGRTLDNTILRNEFDDILPHPQAQSRTEFDLMKKYETMENERKTLEPQPDNIDFRKMNQTRERSILAQRPTLKEPIKSTQERFGNANRYFSSHEAQEPEVNIHLLRKRRAHPAENIPSPGPIPVPANDNQPPQRNGLLDNDDDDDDENSEDINKLLDEIGQEIDNENELEQKISTPAMNNNDKENFHNVPLSEKQYQNGQLNGQLKNNVSNNRLQEVIEKKISQDLDQSRNLDPSIKIAVDHSAPHNLFQKDPFTPIQEVNRVSNDHQELGAINDMENNYANQSDIKMLKDINHIKSPYLDEQTISKASTYASTYPIIPANRTRYVIKEHFISIDSQNRDLELYPNPVEFQVKFEPAADSLEKRKIVDPHGNLLFEEMVRFVADDRGAFLNKRFDNIYSISIVCAIIPFHDNWVCGNCPSQYNNAVLDFNQTIDTNNFPSLPNGPIFTNDVGVLTTILDEPYIILKVDELESWSPYYGTNLANNNAFAKLVYDGDFGRLNSFVKFRTCEPHEKFIFSPHALNSIDKMTISLRKFNNLLLDVGQDKTFIESIKEGEQMRNCPKNGTRITVCPVPECEPCEDVGHCLRPGDIIFIYRTKPDCHHIIPFNKNITIDCINFIEDECGNISNLIELVLCLKQTTQNTLKLDGIINPGDYIAITYKNLKTGETKQEIIKIIEVIGNIIRIDVYSFQARDDLEDIDIIKLGFGRSNPKGIQSQEKCTLNYIGGVRVCRIVDRFTVDIDLPYSKLSNEIKENIVCHDFFFIKQRLQISYTFKIETLDKDYHELDSEAIF